MTKLTLSNISNLQNESSVVTALTNNNTATIAAVENTVSRDGTTPNHMNADLDMNSNRIINLPDALTDQEPATFGQLNDYINTVEAGAVGASALTAPKKNYIINGAMMVSQENGSTAGTTNGYYPVDCFSISYSNAGAISIAQVASTTPAGSPNRLRITVTTADAAVAAGDVLQINQGIEGLRVADLLAGSASAKSVTLRFGVKAPAGTYCIGLRNSAINRSYAAEFTISSGEANTDVVKSVTIQLDQSGTWLKDNGAGMFVTWVLMGGTTYQTTPNTWQAGNYWATANQFNFMGTLSNVFELFDVSLTEGTVAPTYQVPDYASEILLCKRYYQKYGGETQFDAALAVYATSASAHNCPMVFFTEMRVAPTPVFVGTWLYTNGSAISHAIKSKTTILFTITTSAAGYANYYNNVAGTSYMALNSRM